MDSVSAWTGATACALQSALRLSNEAFAEHLGIGARTVAGWHQKPTLRPKSEMQQLLDTALEQASQPVKARFVQLARGEASELEETSPETERRLSLDPNIATALSWIDEHAGWEPGRARREVASRLVKLDIRELEDRSQRRARVDQRNVADALRAYYSDRPEGYGCYTARYQGSQQAVTSILTNPEWLDLACPLTAEHDRLTVTSAADSGTALDEYTTGHAVQRLAETLAMDAKLVDMPLYRLLGTDLGDGRIAGAAGVTRFVHYALTMDLLEGELLDALAAGTVPQPGTLPLRDRYLPHGASALDLRGRLCAGGTLALCAIARPADPYRGPADYVLLVQARSDQVVNAARQLAVIPKGFHQPMTDYRADVQVGATLRREMEEELFGRDDIDNTVTDQRRAAPMHPNQLSEPMRWLLARAERMRIECTGFGLNLVSGNFEFPSLIVIEDEEFWTRYGGEIEANWESSGLRQYSSRDHELLGELMRDVGWSNEGLFALAQGLRRLAEIGGNRVNLPTIDWEIC